ncbi:unnamed protein product, partial [Mycena citricolor]
RGAAAEIISRIRCQERSWAIQRVYVSTVSEARTGEFYLLHPSLRTRVDGSFSDVSGRSSVRHAKFTATSIYRKTQCVALISI